MTTTTPSTPARHLGPACAGLPTAWFFDVRDHEPLVLPDGRVLEGPPPLSSHQRAQAVDACRTCPVREACLMASLDRNEECGRWGGAGEARRRALRRARADGTLALALAAHWRLLDGAGGADDRELLAVFGGAATHGRPGTFAKGCRCEPCRLAIGAREVRASLARRPARRPPASRPVAA